MTKSMGGVLPLSKLALTKPIPIYIYIYSCLDEQFIIQSNTHI